MISLEHVRDQFCARIYGGANQSATVRAIGALFARRVAGDETTSRQWLDAANAVDTTQADATAIWAARASGCSQRGLAAWIWSNVDPWVSWVSWADSMAFEDCLDDLAAVLVGLLDVDFAPLPNLDAAIVAAIRAGGELNMGYWHSQTCGTTHCRAGWAITLHPMGRELESVFGPALAGAVIYLRCTGSVPDFFDTNNQRVLEDIRRCASASKQEPKP
jgi:hypothetical protein